MKQPCMVLSSPSQLSYVLAMCFGQAPALFRAIPAQINAEITKSRMSFSCAKADSCFSLLNCVRADTDRG